MEPLQEKLEIIKADVATFVESCKSIQVFNEETKMCAINFLQQIKTRAKRIEELRKEFTGDLNAQIKKINNMFKMQSEPLDAAEEILKKNLKTYLDKLEREAYEEADRLRKEQEVKRIEEEKRLAELEKLEETAKPKELEGIKREQAAIEEALMTPAEMVATPQKTIRTGEGSVTMKKVWKWKVINEEELRKARPDLFILDEKTMNRIVVNGERDLPGIEIYQDSQLSVSI